MALPLRFSGGQSFNGQRPNDSAVRSLDDARLEFAQLPHGKPMPEPTAVKDDLAKAGLTKGRVLVVDDEPAIRWDLGRFLELSGFAVQTAEDGLHATKLLFVGTTSMSPWCS